MLLYLMVFTATAAIMIAAGSVLTLGADAIAERTGIGRAWIGAVLLAGATSLPELTTAVSAVRVDAPNLAAGDLFGSSLANMLILAIVDLLPPRGRVLRHAAIESALAGCLAIVLNLLGLLFVLLHPKWTLFGISPASALILLVYLGGSRAVYRSGLRQSDGGRAERGSRKVAGARPARSLRWTIAGLAGATVAICATAPLLSWSAKNIAEVSGLGTTFVGTWLLGLCTSIPEFAASLAAVRIGSFDLAVGNLFGSNSFNMVIFLALDIANPAGSIFGTVSPVHAISVILAIVLMSLGLAAILYRAERRFMMIEPDSALMLLTYCASMWLLYTHTRGR